MSKSAKNLKNDVAESVEAVAEVVADELAVSTATGNDPILVETPFWQTLADDAKVYNLAYGANLSKESIERRKLEPLESFPVRVRGVRLTFRLPGLPLIEPSFGDLEAMEGKDATQEYEMHGVCHLLTKTGWRRLQTTEGGGGLDRRSYIPHKVKCVTYDGREIEAYALMTERGRVQPPPVNWFQAPSARYVGKILQGGDNYKLDARYIEAVKKLPVTEAPLVHKIFIGVLLLVLSPLIIGALIYGRIRKQHPSSNSLFRFVAVTGWWLASPFVSAHQRLREPVRAWIKPRL